MLWLAMEERQARHDVLLLAMVRTITAARSSMVVMGLFIFQA
jgi:hypothetical protein